MKRCKRTFLLLEILVALSLMAILLSLLLSFMVQSVKVEARIEKARKVLIQRQNLQIRLQDIFTSLSPGSSGRFLYTQKFPKEEFVSLVASFDNGIDVDPAFSGDVIGRIYVDENKDLCFACFPGEKQNPGTNRKDRPWRKVGLV